MESHLDNLEEVLKRLQTAGLRLNKEKCFFLGLSINYLGHVIGQDGLHHQCHQGKVINISI